MSASLYSHVVEVGAGDRASSEALNDAIWRQAGRITLYEPNAILCADLRQATQLLTCGPSRNGLLNPFNSCVRVYETAVSNVSGEGDLVHMGYASYLDSAPSFLATSVEPEGIAFWKPLMRPVDVVDIKEVDDGSWTYLILTNAGCELDVLGGLKSRPEVIRTKHYVHNAAQAQVARMVWQWMTENRYQGRIVETNTHHTFHHMHWERI